MTTDKKSQLSQSEESYIETIDGLIRQHGYARVTEIAATLNVKPPSVTHMLQKLDNQKYVIYKRYRGVILTPKGKTLANKLERRHQALKKFLTMIGVSEENANKDACEIEHKINYETMTKLAKFVEFVQSAPEIPLFLKHFKHYLETGKKPEECKVKL